MATAANRGAPWLDGKGAAGRWRRAGRRGSMELAGHRGEPRGTVARWERHRGSMELTGRRGSMEACWPPRRTAGHRGSMGKAPWLDGAYWPPRVDGGLLATAANRGAPWLDGKGWDGRPRPAPPMATAANRGAPWLDGKGRPRPAPPMATAANRGAPWLDGACWEIFWGFFLEGEWNGGNFASSKPRCPAVCRGGLASHGAPRFAAVVYRISYSPRASLSAIPLRKRHSSRVITRFSWRCSQGLICKSLPSAHASKDSPLGL